MKKTILLALFLVTSLLCGTTAFAEDNVSVSPTIVSVDGTNKHYLIINLDNTNDKYIGCQMDITLPEGLSFYKNASNNAVITLNSSRFFADVEEGDTPWSPSQSFPSEKTLRVMVSNTSNPFILGNTGELLKVRIIANNDAVGGSYECKVSNILFSVKGENYDAELADAKGYVRVLGTETVSLNIPSGGFATLCLPFAAELKDGMKAYKATGISDGAVVMTELETIEACTPIVISGVPGTYDFSGDNSAATAFSYTKGAMTGVLVPTPVSEGYVLQEQSSGFGFYRLDSEKILPTYRCVLSKGSGVSYLPIRFGETTGINAIDINEQDNRAYTLDGKQVNSFEKGGLYILNGKKIYVK